MLSYKFAEFTLVSAHRKLFRDGKEMEMRDRDFCVLLILIENRPQILSKDKIIKSVWNGLAVEDNSVERALVNIRKMLGDSASNPRFIKTVRGKGYLFVGEVAEIGGETRLSSDTEPYKIIEPDGKPYRRRKLSRWISPVLITLILIGTFSLVGWNGNDFYENLTSRTLLYEDFSGGEIDPQKWTVKGNNVRLSGGIAKITVDEIDNGGNLQSKYFAVDPDKPLMIKSRIKISYNQSVQSNINFVGAFGIVVANNESETNFYGVKYANAEGEFCYQDNIIKTEGFYLVRDDGDVRENRHHIEGKIGPQVESVWEKWFEQKLIYQPQNETMLFFIDGEKKGEFKIGKLPFGNENKLRLEIYPRGWWLHHSLEIDDILITQ